MTPGVELCSHGVHPDNTSLVVTLRALTERARRVVMGYDASAPPCPRCGTPFPLTGRFCPGCGLTQEVAQDPFWRSSAAAPASNDGAAQNRYNANAQQPYNPAGTQPYNPAGQ